MSNWIPSQSSRYASRKPISGRQLPAFLDDSYIFHDKSFLQEKKRITNCKSSRRYYRKNIDLEREKARTRMRKKRNPSAITSQASTSATDGDISSSDDDEKITNNVVTDSEECTFASQERVTSPAELGPLETIACDAVIPCPQSPSVSMPPKYRLKETEEAIWSDTAETNYLNDVKAVEDFLEETEVEDLLFADLRAHVAVPDLHVDSGGYIM